MINYLNQFVENLFFHPRLHHKIVSILLLPISLIYATSMTIRRIVAKREKFNIPIISIGNLIVGGSGKTPFTIALAKSLDIEDIFIVSRGYGRKSRGLIVVSDGKGNILCDVNSSGDEPMLMAKSLPSCGVIVSENRKEGIREAISRGAKLILLDDGFNRVDIEKFDIVLEPKDVSNTLPLPSGPFREFRANYRYANTILKEGKGYNRIVKTQNSSPKMVLATAIANPKRLDEYLSDGVVAKIYKKDHQKFEIKELEELLKRYNANSILMTQKDIIKLSDNNLPISTLLLEIEIDRDRLKEIKEYIKDFYAKKA